MIYLIYMLILTMNYKWNNIHTQKPNLDDFNFDFSKPKTPNKNQPKLPIKSKVQPLFDQWDQDTIDKDFREKSKCLKSSWLPVNTIAEDLSTKIMVIKNSNDTDKNTKIEYLYEQYNKFYTKYLPEHWWVNWKRAKELKLNDELDTDIGWKFHVNIKPEHVVVVDTYLKDAGFNFKFLHWGDIEDWKIFTIYIGSYALMKQLAEVLHRNIWKYLCKPQQSCTDIEFAQWVVWRFARDWSPTWRTWVYKYGFPVERMYRHQSYEKMELISYRILKEKFLDYFHK